MPSRRAHGGHGVGRRRGDLEEAAPAVPAGARPERRFGRPDAHQHLRIDAERGRRFVDDGLVGARTLEHARRAPAGRRGDTRRRPDARSPCVRPRPFRRRPCAARRRSRWNAGCVAHQVAASAHERARRSRARSAADAEPGAEREPSAQREREDEPIDHRDAREGHEVRPHADAGETIGAPAEARDRADERRRGKRRGLEQVPEPPPSRRPCVATPAASTSPRPSPPPSPLAPIADARTRVARIVSGSPCARRHGLRRRRGPSGSSVPAMLPRLARSRARRAAAAS